MKKPEISYRCFGDSGPLSIYWFDGPYGDAVESLKGDGVGWFSHDGQILGVEFDDVEKIADKQSLVFKGGVTIELKVTRGKIVWRLIKKKKKSSTKTKAA